MDLKFISLCPPFILFLLIANVCISNYNLSYAASPICQTELSNDSMFGKNSLTRQREILADYDDQGIFIYQAFSPDIAAEAVSLGRFGEKFRLNRMTWIKPSLGWMLYRSKYASSAGQERILRIKISHEGFLAILRDAIPSQFDSSQYSTERDWRNAFSRSNTRYQWDQDRDFNLQPLSRRALQLGINGEILKNYVSRWILGITDITTQVKALNDARRNGRSLPQMPVERPYRIDPQLEHSLGMLL